MQNQKEENNKTRMPAIDVPKVVGNRLTTW